jgi:addiction module HigA family antidote
VIKSFKDRDTQ